MGKISGLGGITSTPTIAPPPWTPSPQQQAIFDFADNSTSNATIEAVAGAGKTTTLVEVCKRIPSGGVFLAFNKAIAQEIGAKLATAGIDSKRVKSATFHSVGFQAWVRHAPASGRNVKGEKLDILAEKIGVPRHLQTFCKKLVSLAKQACVGVVCPLDDDTVWLQIIEHFDLLDDVPAGDEELDDEEIIASGLAWSLKLLESSIHEAATMIDFDDMIFMPLYTQLKLWQYSWVLVDEAQDTNVARRLMAHRLLAPSGRLIAVGDPHQAIYGFTGADADALDLITAEFQCERLPLTVTYRCPKAVVAHAQQWVSHIQAADTAPKGSVEHTGLEEFRKTTPAPGSAIVCRNVRPIVSLAFDYMRRRIPCHIEGRDIGRGLLTLSRKWRSAQTLGELSVQLSQYLEKERERLLAAYKMAQVQTIEDKVTTLQVLINSIGYDQPIAALQRVIEQLFADSPPGEAPRKIILSTVHKAKGREWNTVYLLGRNMLMPSPYAKQEWELQQEKNLCYVAVTRAKDRLVEVNLPTKK